MFGKLIIMCILKRTTESGTLLSYLDMTVYINHDRFSTSLYDKRDCFSFEIVNFQ